MIYVPITENNVSGIARYILVLSVPNLNFFRAHILKKYTGRTIKDIIMITVMLFNQL